MPSPSNRDEWMMPGVHEVVPGVYRVPLPLPNDGLRAVNVYVLTGTDGPVLIDSGWAIPQARELLAEGLRELGATLADIRRILVTHIHRDHYTQAVHLRREFGTRVTLGAEERWSLQRTMRPGRTPIAEQLDRLRALGATDLAELIRRGSRGVDPADWEEPDDWLDPTDVVAASGRSLQMVATPGHTRGHVVFHDVEAALLFAGDHVLPTITPSIGFEPAPTPDPLGDFLRSLAVVRGRADAMLLPAHGPVTRSVHARVDELVDHHDARLRATAAALDAGAETAAAVAGRLTWTRRERALDDLDAFNQFLAISETGAHLDLLVARGVVTRQVAEGGVRLYHPA
jgi:glyoxylase-like metal-dependent hydrolase (beta-lactamase superfamily II)